MLCQQKITTIFVFFLKIKISQNNYYKKQNCYSNGYKFDVTTVLTFGTSVVKLLYKA